MFQMKVRSLRIPTACIAANWRRICGWPAPPSEITPPSCDWQLEIAYQS